MKRVARQILVRTLRFGADESGAVMAEFVIITPLFLFLILGIIQFMGIAHADSMLQYANFMAARTGIVHYEAMSHGWNTDAGGVGSWRTNLEDKMEEGAKTAFGPLYKMIPGDFDTPYGAGYDGPLATSPAAIWKDSIDLEVGVVATTGMERVPYWLTCRTQVDMKLGTPWVGRIIEVIARGGKDNFETKKGIDPFLSKGEPAGMSSIDEAARWTVKSDNFMDLRNVTVTMTEAPARELPWPLSTTGGYTKLEGGSETIEAHDPHPVVMPIQFRYPVGAVSP